MATICYAWNDAPFKWNEAPITWREGCLIEEVTKYGTAPSIRKRLKELDEEDKQVLISLVTRLKENDVEFEKRINKNKNTKANVTIKDVEIFLIEAKKISVNIFINENNKK